MTKHPILAWLIITLIAILFGWVIINGTIQNGGDFVPDYKPPSTPAFLSWS